MTSLHVGTLDQPTAGGRSRPGEPLLEVAGLCADYGIGPDAVHAVLDADLVLHRGEVLGRGRAAAASPRSRTPPPGCCGRRA